MEPTIPSTPDILVLEEVEKWFAEARRIDAIACERLELTVWLHAMGGNRPEVFRAALVSVTLHGPSRTNIYMPFRLPSLSFGISSPNRVHRWRRGCGPTSSRRTQL